ncbi:MAG: hypothetical protein KKH29_04340 [Candidatus Omnitrophica bacterium]|nr:hypothetical protein [Candidatus Omnitrophota bacterium]MBU4346539.1 hypothetical protein [Candidatus Omnitrophota bacterium]MBU4472715.1 hypothetical protein [Candidatus Omnitrophota bacterium]MCG2706400.1 hypothetical protein [Candidatus Omnitrophota bacterium]
MKRSHIILSAFLTLAIVVIIISVYIAKQSLIEITQGEEKLPVPAQEQKDVSLPVSAFPMITEQRKELLETKKQETELPTFDLDQIPEEYFNKDIQDKEQIEELSEGERRLNKQPSLRQLKELKVRGMIIQ